VRGDREHDEAGRGVKVAGATRIDRAFVGLKNGVIVLASGVEA
jgi:hypothetical protein